MATKSKRWTLEELHGLPDDGNKYELVHGDLLVTPPPSVAHEELAAVLFRILDRYAEVHGLGRVYRPRAVVQTGDSEVEPDLMVRATPHSSVWSKAPLPILIVEIASGSTRRRDRTEKRKFYLDLGIPEYWIVDGKELSVRVVRPGQTDLVMHDAIAWAPSGAGTPLTIDLPQLFREALGQP